jgi:hypothetical protein
LSFVFFLLLGLIVNNLTGPPKSQRHLWKKVTNEIVMFSCDGMGLIDICHWNLSLSKNKRWDKSMWNSLVYTNKCGGITTHHMKSLICVAVLNHLGSFSFINYHGLTVSHWSTHWSHTSLSKNNNENDMTDQRKMIQSFTLKPLKRIDKII